MWTTSVFWDNYVSYFTKLGYHTTAINLLHHGDSKDKLRHIGIMDYVNQMAHELNSLGGTHVVIGHSMGALIAHKIAELGYASQLILMAAPGSASMMMKNPAILRMFSANIVDTLLKRPFIIPERKAVYGLMNTLSPEQQSSLYRGFVYESGSAMHDIACGRISIDSERGRCPVLVIAGGQDRIAPPSVEKKVAVRYKASYIEYPEHCHVSLVNGPGWKNPAGDIARWLESQNAQHR
jgi:pimeloyl-ACP methyl ester carboxylesterase